MKWDRNYRIRRFAAMLLTNVAALLLCNSHFETGQAVRLGQTTDVHMEGNVRSTKPRRYPPDLMAKLRKINQTQAKARRLVQEEELAFQNSKKKAKEMKIALKQHLLKVKKEKTWILQVKNKIEKLEQKKTALKVKYDLDRIKPYLHKAEEHQKELSSEEKKWKSSSSAMTDKVRELESKLKDLSAAEEGGAHKDAEIREDKPKEDDVKNKKREAKLTKLDVDLDGLLDELDAAQK